MWSLLIALVAIALVALASLPYWLPAVGRRAADVAVRPDQRGRRAIAVPGDLVDVARFLEVYSHPAANGRSRGAALSDLFWYWLSPGAEVHQEHLERGTALRRGGAVHPPHPGDADARRPNGWPSSACAPRCRSRTGLVRLRDLVMPVWAEFYYRLVFGQPGHRRGARR